MPGAIVVRVLAPTDAIEYVRARLEQVELESNAFAETPDEVRGRTLAAWTERLAAPRTETGVIGAFADGRIVGTAGWFRRLEAKTRHKGRVWGVYVAPAFRGQGLGRVLMRALLDEARTIEGLEQLDLSVAVTQAPARQLYESLGFVVYGCERRALKVGGAYVDEDLMALRLTP